MKLTKHGWVIGSLLVLVGAASPACSGDDSATTSTGGSTSGNPSPECSNPSQTKCGALCYDTSTDPKHCGGCAINCAELPGVDGTNAVCNNGQCVLGGCAAGHADCNGLAQDGCETETTTSEHCGSCDVACSSPLPVCAKDEQSGAYVCADGCPASTPTLCGTSCVNLDKDPNHCGECNISCQAPPLADATCNAGVCEFACDVGSHKCGPTCMNDLSTKSCGASCAPCPIPANGAPTCDGTACGIACNPGFVSDGAACTDVDECVLGTNNCSPDATCTNVPGSFSCACKPGFVGDGVTCVNANECVLNTDNCDVNAICTDAPGGYTCSCKPGYEGDGYTCTNVDECALGTHDCDVNATCIDTQGGFACTCNAGYTGNGVTCNDVNECTNNSNNCSPDATCSNTLGSFMCDCNQGYEGDGVTCLDVDECANGTSGCSAAESCVNTAGGYACDCVQPNLLCGGSCSDLDSDEAHCGACATSCAAGKVCVSGVCVGAGNLRITLVWSRLGDLDLHILTPGNKHIYYANKGPNATTDNGWLDHDDTTKRGPENIYWDSIYTPPSGTYNICVVPYSFTPDVTVANPVTFTVTIARPNLPEQVIYGTRTSEQPTSECTIMSPYYLTSFTYP